MAELYINKRVKYAPGKQSAFLQSVQRQTGLSFKKISRIANVSQRNMLEWRKENRKMSLYALHTLTKYYGIPMPKNIKIIDEFEHTRRAGKMGARAVAERYGAYFALAEKNRKISWEKWWQTKGSKNLNKILVKREISLPKKSEKLAELCGIIIGDGGISKYQVRITLNRITDKEYVKFVTVLLKNLFKVKPKLYRFKNSKALDICVSRTNLVTFLVEHGMKIGNKLKQNILIPEWILASRKYTIACIRGMVDTDGCVVKETHTIQKKKYIYRRLNFTSASPNLVHQTVTALKNFGFHPKVRRKGRSVQLENFAEICDYFKRIGTHNPKHARRFKEEWQSGRSHRS